MATPMTPDQMLEALRAEGLTVREFPGWRTRCRCCPDTGPHKTSGPYIREWGDVNGGLQHITGGGLGNRTVEEYIRDIILFDKSLLTKCQFVTDPDGVVWLVAAGRANHAGSVGGHVRDHMRAADFSLTDDYDDRYRGASDDGNGFTYGNEAIAASKMNAKQRAASVLLWAAVARFHKWTGQETAGHGEVASARTDADPNLHMGDFRRDIVARVAGTPPTPPTTPADPEPADHVAVWGNPATWVVGSTGDAVTRLGERLVIWAKALGLPAPYEVGPGPEFTPTDRDAVAAFQRAQGWSGADADGFPGEQSFTILASTPPSKPKPPATTWTTERIALVNCACYNAARGKANRASRIPRIAKRLLSYKPDVVLAIELSADQVAVMEAKLKGYFRAERKKDDGKKGREIFLRDGLTLVASGIARPATTLNGDDKPYVWAVYREGDGTLRAAVAFHNENQDGVDAKSRKDADAIRADQMTEVIEGSWKQTDAHDVPRENVAFGGDGNSYNWARQAAEALGLRSAVKVATDTDGQESYKTHNGWDAPTKGEHFDIVLVLAGVIVRKWGTFISRAADLFKTDGSSRLSDHHIVVVDREVIR